MDAPPPLSAQNMTVKPMEEIITNTTTNTCVERQVLIRPEKDVKPILNCPRCNSSNTKFCYYNNHSLTQPRYFCKTCKRYWTHGGSLRNIPVGGNTRKKKAQSLTNYKIKLPHDQQLLDQPPSINPNYPKSLIHHAQDLNLGNFTTSTHHLLYDNPYYDHRLHPMMINVHDFNTSNNNYPSAMELLTGITIDASSRGSVISPFVPIQHISDPNPNPVYPVGFPFQGDFRPSLGFSPGRSKAADDHHQDHINDQHITRNHDQHEDWTENILGGPGSW